MDFLHDHQAEPQRRFRRFRSLARPNKHLFDALLFFRLGLFQSSVATRSEVPSLASSQEWKGVSGGHHCWRCSTPGLGLSWARGWPACDTAAEAREMRRNYISFQSIALRLCVSTLSLLNRTEPWCVCVVGSPFNEHGYICNTSKGETSFLLSPL